MWHLPSQVEDAELQSKRTERRERGGQCPEAFQVPSTPIPLPDAPLPLLWFGYSALLLLTEFVFVFFKKKRKEKKTFLFTQFELGYVTLNKMFYLKKREREREPEFEF